MVKDYIRIYPGIGLTITVKGMVYFGFGEDGLYKAYKNKTPGYEFGIQPGTKNRLLVVWSGLRPDKKEKIVKLIGDPYEYIAKQPLRDMLSPDPKAEQVFRTELLSLKVGDLNKYVSEYTLQASWLNLLVTMQEKKALLKSLLGLTFKGLLEIFRTINESDNVGLPSNRRKLEAKIKEYKQEGYKCLISGKFGNKNSAKIGKGEFGFDPEIANQQIALIRKAGSMHNNFDPVQITKVVNLIFDKNGWPQVSHTTVYNILEKNQHLIVSGSRGKRAYQNEIAMQVKRTRPEFPFQYFTLDGWTVELGFIDDTGKVSRLVAVIVIDVMNNYPIGYAIGERESAELIRQANRNAILHAQELFGALYRPWQIQSDNFAIKANTYFFQAMAKLHTPTAVGNAKSKVIEPYFKYLNKTYCQPQYNWMGFNVDAKKSNQVNREFSNAIKKSFPDKLGVIEQIDAIINKDRFLKKESYVKQWEICPEDKRPEILAKMDWLMVFGKPTGFTNSVTGVGLMPTIEGQQLIYDSFDPQFRALQHLNWKVIYDEYDLTSILVISEDDKQRFVLEQKRAIPMAIRDMKPEDHAYLSKINQFKKDREKQVMQTYIEDAAIVNEVLNDTLYLDSDAELALKGMFTYKGQQKEALQDAKGLKRIEEKKEKKRVENEQQQEVDNWNALQQRYLESKVDFNQNWDEIE